MDTGRLINKIRFAKQNGEKLFALLIDPDKHNHNSIDQTIHKANEAHVDFIFIGGSLLLSSIEESVKLIKKSTDIPVILFPGSLLQITSKADAILLLSLISGRNPDLLIGNHVIAASKIKQSGLEVLSTGYILIDGGKPTSVEYMSNTKPIPANKHDIALATAMAGEMLGQNLIYLEAGSGADSAISSELINKVSQNINVPLIVGGGIRTPEQATEVFKAGADIIVAGTIVEDNPDLLFDLSLSARTFRSHNTNL